MIGTVLLTILATLAVVMFAINFTTPEKQLLRKLKHKYSTEDDQFQREMSVMLGPTVLAGNQITALQNGREIFPALLKAIRGAQQSVCFETYIYWSGNIGKQLADALTKRALAGVPVHVLIDWAGSLKMEPALMEQIKDSGVKVHHYRPLHWYNLGRMNNRTHRKLLIVDGQVAFTGGVGIADQWDGDAQDPQHWRDIHFYAEGPVVAQFQAAFNDNWIKTTGEVLNGPIYFPRLKTAGQMSAQLFLSSPSGGSESMQLMYLTVIAAAEKHIDLQAAYFVPDPLTMQALLAATRRKVRIRINVPGEHIDSDAVRLASKSVWGQLLAAGVEIYEFLPTMLHNKMLIVDDVLVSVGSTNFDTRSFKLNDEASMNIYDAAFAQQMRAVFESDLLRSRSFTYDMWVDRPTFEKFAEKFLIPLKSQL
jgi:cardiolipin synthase A/B